MFPALMKKRFLKGKLGKLRNNCKRIELPPEMRNRLLIAAACLAFIFLVLCCRSPSAQTSPFSKGHCQGRFVYIHPLPPEFNENVLASCELMPAWAHMCAALSNAGLGSAIPEDEAEIFTPTGWHRTRSLALEAIFHNRMKQYDCLTEDSREASAVFVPYYAGLDSQRTLWANNLAARDVIPKRLEEWLLAQPAWAAHHGHDHFMVGARITWDFRSEGRAGRGNVLLTLPGIKNMTTLVIEASPWDALDIAIPYPSYFHPSSDAEIRAWQEKVRGLERKHLFAFAGARRDDKPRLIRGQLIRHCRQSPFCELLTCDGGVCGSPQVVMKLFEESHFCLQPQGDSFTRKSIFDSMLAGCIPVFFHEHSFSGYSWHLPKNQSEYSVFILENYIRSGNLSVESVLRNISTETIQKMRERIIELIPNLLYADPRSSTLETSIDAVGIALKGVFERIAEKKRSVQQVPVISG